LGKQRVVVAGGSGFLGRALARHLLQSGYEVDILTRAKSRPVVGNGVLWDGATVGDWAQRVEGAAAVINLAGKSVNCRYNAENRREIIASRVNSVRAIGGAIRNAATPAPVWIQAASLAIYGSPGAAACDENAPHGTGFSAEVCERWEFAFNESVMPSGRKVLLRIGIVLGPGGGALGILAPLARWGLGGRTGNGRQYCSWIHFEFSWTSMENSQRPERDKTFSGTCI